ncbi:hypothetical protein SAMN04488556_3748 [Halostagnicola kamekurae]|uniref:Uncharacterized protein n=1 Tax=Halostagnicola kamekurae TaxID=619731 RepID=A0A1I6UCJ9_9EURY|nr:hypothetical protein SAMN04488556_3748 [Halostagnicola kamekurae]
MVHYTRGTEPKSVELAAAGDQLSLEEGDRIQSATRSQTSDSMSATN